MWLGSLLLLYLGILALLDARKRELPMGILSAGTALAAGAGSFRLITGSGSWAEILLGSIPGIVLILLALLTNSTGTGDGIVLLQIDLCLSVEGLIITFGTSLLLIGVFAMLILLARRGDGKIRLPYMPFLWAGCLLALLCG